MKHDFPVYMRAYPKDTFDDDAK